MGIYRKIYFKNIDFIVQKTTYQLKKIKILWSYKFRVKVCLFYFTYQTYNRLIDN